MGYGSRNWTSAEIEQPGWLWGVSIIVIATGLLLSVAFYNRYPTAFSDTGGYLLTGASLVAYPPYRAPGYSIFMRLASHGASAWFIVIAQALIVVYVLREACHYLIGSDRKFNDLCLLGCVGALTALSSLPWLASLLMPDVFTGVVLLTAFLLAFAEDMRRSKRVILAAILFLSVSTHMSLLPIVLLFIPFLVGMRLFFRRSGRISSAGAAVLVSLLVPVFLSALLTATMNRKMGLGFRVSPSKNDFVLATLFGDGLASDYLRQNCPKGHFISCRYLSNLPRTQEEFLFRHALYPQLLQHPAEMERIVDGTLSKYPQKFAEDSVRGTLLQLTSLQTGDEVRSYGAKDWNKSALQHVFPDEFHAFLNARQFDSSLLRLADAAAALDTKAFWFCLVGCFALGWSRKFERVNAIFACAVYFLVVNAAVCATFAGVFDRYQSRVAWVIPFCLSAYVCCWAAEWRRAAMGRYSRLADFDYSAALSEDSPAFAGSGEGSFTNEVREDL